MYFYSKCDGTDIIDCISKNSQVITPLALLFFYKNTYIIVFRKTNIKINRTSLILYILKVNILVYTFTNIKMFSMNSNKNIYSQINSILFLYFNNTLLH